MRGRYRRSIDPAQVGHDRIMIRGIAAIPVRGDGARLRDRESPQQDPVDPARWRAAQKAMMAGPIGLFFEGVPMAVITSMRCCGKSYMDPFPIGGPMKVI